MKKWMVIFTGVMMAAVLAACSPTTKKDDHEHQSRNNPPAGAMQESSIDGALEKSQMVVDADPTVTVCIYTFNDSKNGLKQNMDAVDGEELDAQALIDKMAELGVIEEGIKVESFEDKDGVLSLNLSSLKEPDNKMVTTAIANTFIQNYEAETLNLSVAGQSVGGGTLEFLKEYKKMK